jgi:thiamine pyrophosphokinase
MERNETMTTKFDAVILANGDYPTSPQPLEILHRGAPYVACCDGAVNEFIRHGGIPDAIVGDCDSLSDEIRTTYACIIHKIDEQEYNDLSKTIKFLMSIGKRSIAILGATGKREDHTLGNISLLIEYMQWGIDVRMYTDHGVFIPCNGMKTLPCLPGQQLSLFSFGAVINRADGLRYPLYNFTNWWQGTLNECLDHKVTIHAQGDYLVYLNYFA